MYMTKRKYERLEVKRDYVSFFGFMCIMLNLLIGLAAIVGSLITGESLIASPKTLIATLVVAVITGLFAVANFLIGKALKSARILV